MLLSWISGSWNPISPLLVSAMDLIPAQAIYRVKRSLAFLYDFPCGENFQADRSGPMTFTVFHGFYFSAGAIKLPRRPKDISTARVGPGKAQVVWSNQDIRKERSRPMGCRSDWRPSSHVSATKLGGRPGSPLRVLAAELSA